MKLHISPNELLAGRIEKQFRPTQHASLLDVCAFKTPIALSTPQSVPELGPLRIAAVMPTGIDKDGLSFVPLKMRCFFVHHAASGGLNAVIVEMEGKQWTFDLLGWRESKHRTQGPGTDPAVTEAADLAVAELFGSAKYRNSAVTKCFHEWLVKRVVRAEAVDTAMSV